MVKKLLTSVLVATLLILCALPVSAAQLSEEPAGTYYKYVTRYKHAKGYVYFYAYNISPESTARMTLKNLRTNEVTTFNFKDAFNHPVPLNLGTTDYYEQYRYIGNSGAGGGGNLKFNGTDGVYEQIKIKLPEFISGCNPDGSITKSGSAYGTHIFNFTEEEIGVDKFYSSLIFESGSAITLAAPDKQGYVNVVVCKTPGVTTYYSTDFGYFIRSTSYTSGGGGGTNRGTMHGLTMGDVDKSGYMTIDDATVVQMDVARLTSIKNDPLAMRNGDLNGDGKITIDDATLIQMAIAKLK